MNQPSAEELKKIFEEKRLTVSTNEQAFQAILDRYHLIDKTEPIPGAVSADEIVSRIEFFHGDPVRVAENITQHLDIFPKGTVARLMGEVEELKKVIDEIINYSESQQKIKELQAEIDRLKGQQKPEAMLPDVPFLAGSSNRIWSLEVSRFLQAVKAHLQGRDG